MQEKAIRHLHMHGRTSKTPTELVAFDR